ncbi:MAG: hypothetical protein OEU92_20370, partial [Alphaproteobacteria bacterium]|nr:hypothetical protein [Alphaproteobacteria bacterium]
MTDQYLYPVPDAIAQSAHVDEAGYREMYRRSVEDSEGFWADQAKRL